MSVGRACECGSCITMVSRLTRSLSWRISNACAPIASAMSAPRLLRIAASTVSVSVNAACRLLHRNSSACAPLVVVSSLREQAVRRRSKILITLGVIAAVMVAVRVALPSIITREVNQRLHTLEAYDGRIQDVDLALWRGAYRVKGIEIVKRNAARPIPFLQCPRVDFSVQWRALMHGRLTSELVLFSPDINLVRAETEERSQLGTEED